MGRRRPRGRPKRRAACTRGGEWVRPARVRTEVSARKAVGAPRCSHDGGARPPPPPAARGADGPRVGLAYRARVHTTRRQPATAPTREPLVPVARPGATLADFSRPVGGSASGVQVEAATAGWAIAVLAGLGGFYQEYGSPIGGASCGERGGQYG